MRPCCASGAGCGAGWTRAAMMCACSACWPRRRPSGRRAGQDDSYLLRGSRLAQFEGWAEN